MVLFRLKPTLRTRWLAGLAIACLLLSATYASAQFGRGRGLFGGVRLAPPEFPDRDFTLCRIMYQSVRSEADGAGACADAGEQTASSAAAATSQVFSAFISPSCPC